MTSFLNIRSVFKQLVMYRELPGLVLNPKMEFGKDHLEWCWDWGWGSFKCRCQMSMPDCTPVDGWDTILVCDNVNGVEDLGTLVYTVQTVYKVYIYTRGNISPISDPTL